MAYWKIVIIILIFWRKIKAYLFITLFTQIFCSLLFTQSIHHGRPINLLHLSLISLIYIQFLVPKYNVVCF